MITLYITLKIISRRVQQDIGNGKYNFCFITLLTSIKNYLVICLIQTNIIGNRTTSKFLDIISP
jgi:hypothetical protein